jgi:hypothetical protein
MDSLPEILRLLNALQPPSGANPPAADGDAAPFERVIDRLVRARNRESKAQAKAAVEKSKEENERWEAFRRKEALLASQAREAELAETALEGGRQSPARLDSTNQLLDFRRQEAAYWEGRLRMEGLPAGSVNPTPPLSG